MPGARQSYLVEQDTGLLRLFWQRAIQLRDSWTLAADYSNSDLGELEAEMVAGMHLEKELLIRALKPTRKQTIEQDLFRFLAARIERNKRMKPEQISYQNQQEWRQAFPSWIANLAVAKVKAYSLERLNDAYIRLLKPAPNNEEYDLSYVVQHKYYELSGTAMLELMRRLELDFYAPFQAGFSPYEILNYAYDSSTMDSAAIVDAVAPSDYLDAILLKAKQALAGERDVKSIAAEYPQRGRYHVLFKETGVVTVEYDPFFHYLLPDESYLFRRSLRTLLDAPAYSAEIDGGWQHIFKSTDSYPGQVLELPIDEFPDLSSCSGDGVKYCAAGTRLTGEGFTLDVRTALKVTLVGRELVIEPQTPSAEHPVAYYLSAGRP